jgi:hypothetical protein
MEWHRIDTACPAPNVNTDMPKDYECDICHQVIIETPWKRCYSCNWDCCEACAKYIPDVLQIHATNCEISPLNDVPPLDRAFASEGAIYFDVGPVERVPPQVLTPCITEERAITWLECLEDVVSISGPVTKARAWTLFTDYYQHPVYPEATALAVCWEPGEHYGKVALVISNAQGNISITLLYQNLSSYLEEFETWERCRYSEDRRLELLQTLQAEAPEYDAEGLALASTEFSGYVRFRKNIPLLVEC